MYKGENMVDDMARASRVTVFLLDEPQRVSWSDIGSVVTIQSAAGKFGATFHEPFQLVAQYRCNGSTGWLERGQRTEIVAKAHRKLRHAVQCEVLAELERSESEMRRLQNSMRLISEYLPKLNAEGAGWDRNAAMLAEVQLGKQ